MEDEALSPEVAARFDDLDKERFEIEAAVGRYIMSSAELDAQMGLLVGALELPTNSREVARVIRNLYMKEKLALIREAIPETAVDRKVYLKALDDAINYRNGLAHSSISWDVSGGNGFDLTQLRHVLVRAKKSEPTVVDLAEIGRQQAKVLALQQVTVLFWTGLISKRINPSRPFSIRDSAGAPAGALEVFPEVTGFDLDLVFPPST